MGSNGRFSYRRFRPLAIQGIDGMLSFAALAFGDFFAIDAHIDRRLDANANLRAIDCHDGDFDVFTDS